MNRRQIILVLILTLLVALGVYITILYFNRNDTIEEVNSNINYLNETYVADTLPDDMEYEDNKQLYGGWKSEKIEIYRGGKIKTTIIDNKSVIQIYNNDKMDICYIDDDTELICDTNYYSFIDNILYITSNDLYLSGKRDVIFKNDYLILKLYLNNTIEDFSMLYLKKI